MSPLLLIHFDKGTQLVEKSKIGFVHSVKLLNNILLQISNIHDMYHPFPVVISTTMLYPLNAVTVENPQNM